MKIIVLSSHTQSLFWFRMDMMKSFMEAGHTVIAIGSEPMKEWAFKFQEQGIKYRQIPVQRNGINPLKDIKTMNVIKKIFKEEKPDKVFAYQAKSIIYGSIAAKQSNITEFYPLIAGLGSIFRGTGLKNKLIKIVMENQYRVACHFSKKVFFQNNDDKNEFIKNKLVAESKTTIINGSGVNLDRFQPVEQPKLATFLFIGRLIKDKGIIEYLEACKRIKQQYPQVRCLLLGPFDTNPSALKPEELQPYIDSNIIEYFGEQKDVRPYLVMSSTFVLPSYHEGTPKTILEAMAMERSIITTDAPGCRETVEDGVNGYLVKVGDVHSLVQVMEKTILNRELSLNMGKFSLKLAREKYDVNLVNQSIIKTMQL
ncbi:glycosyltransferase family 4 protein [Solibacillus sp. FSL H8-0523]|uniref:glycosyltransferase family 4 protein n=1 Tax=Solibacillus sp. FSL H8-0523 TaxID=2954511 RepID=UPI003100B92D